MKVCEWRWTDGISVKGDLWHTDRIVNQKIALGVAFISRFYINGWMSVIITVQLCFELSTPPYLSLRKMKVLFERDPCVCTNNLYQILK